MYSHNSILLESIFYFFLFSEYVKLNKISRRSKSKFKKDYSGSGKKVQFLDT